MSAIMVRPLAITSTNLTSSTVPEAPGSVYNAGTTYALAARVYTGAVGGVLTVWQSLQAGNLGNTPSSSPLWWIEVGSTYTEYSGAVSYALNDMVIDVATHKEYKSAAAANLGNPLTDATKWQVRGNTNRYKSSDESPESQTKGKGVGVEVITPGQIVDSLVFFNLSGLSSVRVQTTGYDETITLSTRTTAGFWAWAFEPFTFKTEVLFESIPPDPANVLTITYTPQTGAEWGVGLRIPGQKKAIGTPQYGTTPKIISYSSKVVTDGLTTTFRRTPSRRLEAPIHISDGVQAKVDDLYKTFSAYEGVALAWVLSKDYGCTFVYGTYKDFGLVIAGPTHATYQLSIEGYT